MTVIFIILGILAFLLILLLLPVHVKATYETSLFVKVRYTVVSITLYPRPVKAKKQKAEKKSTPKRKKKQKVKTSGLSEIEQMLRDEGITAVIEYFSDLARMAGTAFRKFLAAVIVDSLELNIVVASEDASSTALDYGKTCAAIYPAEGLLESVVHVRHRSLLVVPDFTRNKGSVSGKVRIHAIPIRILWIGIQFFIKYIGNTMNSKS